MAAHDLSVGGAGGAGVFPGYGSVAGIGGIPGAVPGAGGAIYVDLSQFTTVVCYLSSM